MLRFAQLCTLVAFWLGCSSDAEVLYRGQVRIAEGNYRVVTSLRRGDEEFALVVDREAEDDPLLLIPFDGGPPCTAPPPAAAFFSVPRTSGLRLAIYDASRSPRRVQFIDERCVPHLPAVEGTTDVSFEGSFFLITTERDELLYYDPWDEEQTLITDRLTQRGSLVNPGGDGTLTPVATWLLEGDELVLRDFQGAELDRRGDGVTEIAVARGGREMIFNDREGLFRLGGDGSAPERLGEAGCELRYEAQQELSGTVYLASLLSPCDERRLVLILPEQEPQVIASDVVMYFRKQLVTPEGLPEQWTFYATREDSEGPTRYFLLDPEGKTSEIDVPISNSRGHPRLQYLVKRDRAGGPQWLFITNEAEPRLGTWAADTGFVPIVEGTATVVRSPAGLLVHAEVNEDGLGSLLLLESDALTKIAENVPVGGLISLGREQLPTSLLGSIEASSLSSADSAIVDFDGDVGTLTLIQPDGTLRTVARGVPPSSTSAYPTSVRGGELTAPIEGAYVLSYLENYDSERGTGTLSVLLPDDRQLVIDEGVSSHTGDGDIGRPGLLYAIPEGERRGVWFARQ